jgi:Lrp/AsnC family leucine-responsive transcriptional regulator
VSSHESVSRSPIRRFRPDLRDEVREIELPASIVGAATLLSERRLCQGVYPATRPEFLAAVHRQVEITECLLVTGNLDYVLRLRILDVEALRDFILAKLKSIPCVAEIATMLVLEARD